VPEKRAKAMETKHTDKNVYIEVIRTKNMIVNSLMKM